MLLADTVFSNLLPKIPRRCSFSLRSKRQPGQIPLNFSRGEEPTRESIRRISEVNPELAKKYSQYLYGFKEGIGSRTPDIALRNAILDGMDEVFIATYKTLVELS